MEYYDVLDINRNHMGYIKERDETLLDNEYNVGVELWNFYNKKLLLTKRSSNKSHGGEWEVPGGGCLSSETSIESINREIMEEIGYKLDNNSKLIGSSLYKNHYVDIFKSNINIDINKCILAENEVSDIKYVTHQEFLELNKKDLIVKSVFKRYLENQNELDKDWL